MSGSRVEDHDGVRSLETADRLGLCVEIGLLGGKRGKQQPGKSLTAAARLSPPMFPRRRRYIIVEKEGEHAKSDPGKEQRGRTKETCVRVPVEEEAKGATSETLHKNGSKLGGGD